MPYLRTVGISIYEKTSRVTGDIVRLETSILKGFHSLLYISAPTLVKKSDKTFSTLATVVPEPGGDVDR
jgi:hypothetical protein